MIDDFNARNEILTVFNDIVTDLVNGPNSVLGYVPEIRWTGIEETSKTNHAKTWLRPYLEIIDQPQTCLNGGINGSGKTFTTYGLAFFQVFSTKKDNKGIENGLKISIIIRDAFRGAVTPGKIWFTNAKIKQMEPEAHYFRYNVIAEYQYDEKV